MNVRHVFSLHLGDERQVTDTSCIREIRDLRALGADVNEAVERAIAKATEQAPRAASVTLFLRIDAIEVQSVIGQIRPMISVRCSGDYYLQGPE